jgi:nitrous oxidase accessory protein NosD
MKKTLALAGAAVLAASIGLAAPAQASTASKAGGECVQAGLGTLKSLGLLQAAAQKQIDYSTLADAEEGPIFADLETGSNFSLGQVVKLHVKSPELFAWCR